MMKSFKEVYELGTDEYTKHTKDMTPGQSEGMSPAEKRAHAKAIADFKKRGGKITKLPPGKAAGYHGKDDLGKDTFGMLSKSDSGKFKKGKKVRPMRAQNEEAQVDEATDVYDKGGIQITRTALKGGLGFQINYGERGRYIQVLSKDMNNLMKAMQTAMKAK